MFVVDIKVWINGGADITLKEGTMDHGTSSHESACAQELHSGLVCHRHWHCYRLCQLWTIKFDIDARYNIGERSGLMPVKEMDDRGRYLSSLEWATGIGLRPPNWDGLFANTFR